MYTKLVADRIAAMKERSTSLMVEPAGQTTSVLAIPLEEASVKIRQGPPSDDDEDYALDLWAGVLPVQQTFGAPSPDPALRPGIAVPGHISHRVTS